MSDAGGGGPGGGGEEGGLEVPGSAVQNVADVSVLQKHLRKLVPLLLEDGGEVPAALEAALEEKGAVEQMRKFLSDPQVHTVLVERSTLKEDVGDEGEEEREFISYSINTDIHYGLKSNSLAFIKRTPVIDADKPVSSQLRVLTLSEDSPYETLHSFISNAVAPFFKSYIRESGKADRDGDKMAPSVEKKIAELEMGLLHLQQNIEIPEISLPIHPIITNVAKQCYERGEKPKVTDFGDKVEDPTFLNQLQSGVNRWIREIQKVTKLDRDPASGTALQEISFWLNLERALYRIQEKRESPEVLLTLDILKHGKRFHATVSFDTDTGLKQALETVNDYNPLMKDFPLNDLLSATELDKIRQALVAIFTHLRKIRNTKYPIQRALRLVEAISRDLSSQLLKVLGTRKLMHVAYEEFEKVMVACFEVFQTWDDEYEKLQVLLRDIVKRKREENLKMVWRINPAHRKLQARLDQMRKFRRQHEQLRAVIVRVLRPQVTAVAQQNQGDVPEPQDMKVAEVLFDAADANAIEEVNLAYENVKEVDGLDVSKEGTEAWEAAMKRYDERIDRVETRITARLRDQLGTAKNANEMFRIFSRFNALFVRPHIRGAIREYQTQLIQRVKDDIESLHDKFKVQYPQSQACKMSHVRDLPPVSGSIIWAKQIDRQLTAYMKRVEDVLGKGWENHVEGQKLKQDGDSFRMKLNTQEIFDDWARKVQQRNLGVCGRIFTIESTRVRGRTGNVLKLKVNFLPEIITLSKEVRNLKWFGFRVPLAIVNKAHQANQLYPFAISLIESVRTYERTCEKVEERNTISLLVAGLKKEVQALIGEGIALVWESYKLDPYVQRLAETVFSFQEKVDDLLIIEEKIDLEVRSLETCMYDHKTFSEILNRVQKAVDDLNLHSYSNLPIWVNKLDMEIERILGVRLQAGLRAWTQVLLGQADDKAEVDMDTDAPQVSHKPGGEPKIKNIVHELRITNQVIYLNPPIEECRYKLYQEMFSWKMVILSLPRIQSQRYQVGVHYELSEEEKFYRNALTRMPDGPVALEESYSAVMGIVTEVEQYVKVWLQYQCLWDMQAENIYNRLGEDLNKWQALLVQIRKARGTFDNAETRKEFGPVIIDYGKVQSKVNLKYDSWHKEVLSKFGQMLGQNMTEFHSQISKSRQELEQHSVDTASTSDAVTFITYVQSLKRKIKQFEKQVELYRNGQRLLEKQRFQFPSSWLYIDNIEGEWGAFNDIMRRKDSAIQQQVANLQMKIVQEDRAVESRTTDLLTDWEKTKPVTGNLRPEEALQALTIYEGKFGRLKDDREKCAKAKEALELTDTGLLSGSEERVQVALEELQDLKGVWSELSKVWDQIDQMKEQPWVSVQPRKLRQNLDGLLNQLKNFPARLRQYASYEYVQRLLKGYMKINMLVIELKSEALKDRHWKQLMKRLHVNWVVSELTLGQIWDVDLQKNEAIVKDVLLVAQGEMALEEFLKQIREVWNTYELDLVNYQNKCRLIRGWDDLFNKVKEHINSVSAMKLSPYYKVFEEDALSWEDKLNRIMALFDVWIDVQRRWVYLEGIFTGSADIKHLLPVETQRFQSISTEFLALMKKVSKSPLVMDVLNIQGVQRSLERLADLLGKIQKALGEYLERERSSFPRFYFVGDEDLLEIIGNSKNVAKLQKHFKKMFAGVSSIILNEDNSVVLGISSREGEEVLFKTPVSITEHPKINEWLTLVEREMRVTLAKLLAESVTEVEIFGKATSIDPVLYISWIDKYQAQLVVLSAQIAWSENVESALNGMGGGGDSSPLHSVLANVEVTLNVLADSVLMEQPPLRRRKLEHLITELVHQRDVTRSLIKSKIDNSKSFEWLSQMRFYFDPKQTDVLQQLSIQMANAKFNYGFEYLGVQDKLVQTPLTDRCYLTMTQALEARLGGSPFGPAGTGKTESVKALGHQLGRFVLVFNCDETFDFQAMGRIFVGLCQVGAWGCFDEFNRLEERMLSAVSQQVQCIQEALREHCNPNYDKTSAPITCELLNKQVKVSPDMAIFITMNPGYAGRSNLPDNLKKLFRSLAMTKPDRQLIAQVMLYSQGFRTAEVLANKIVPFFKLCDEQLSSQSHYDFGLRALKSVLISAGNVKRERIQKIKREKEERGEVVDEGEIAENLPEQEILIQSVCETMVPKLVAEDIPLLFSLLSDVFPGVQYHRGEMTALREELKKVCQEMYLTYGDGEEVGGMWVEKVLQLYQITQINHGLMMVGPSGSGKSMAWRVLLKALERLEGVEGVAHIIDPKAISKDHLYGTLDPNTREWTDGLFTHVLRKIIDNVRGELQKRQWIIFDGDVDPEWVENLNSVLDDNKLLTLPNGERLSLPPNVSITGEWVPWQSKVPQIEVETHKVAAPDVVVPTLDTVRHEALLYTWLAEHKPLVLCGPPGSGKTMTLFSALRALPDMEVVGLNFSSATTPELLLKTFDHYCEYRRTPNGVVLAPVQLGKWLVLFCDEINLPDMDKYGTQRVISFIRQMVEHGGFYRTSDQTWVKLERIQFVGACNPPTDPGRKPLSHRFLRHVPVVYVDYPGPASLTQIYGTFNRAMLRLIPSLRTYAEPLTAAMVEFYTMSQERFTQDTQPHYIYSPREMTRWVRGIFEALRPLETLPVEGLIRIWAHEALRLFQDRLVEDEERRWTDENIDIVALKHFPNIDKERAMSRPILYSNWLSKDYIPVDQEELRDYVKARLKVFYEEELDVPLVLFNEVLDHVLRIDRIFRQPQGHLLLIGVSGAGKTTLSRFVAWMNGLSVYQIKVHRKYTGEDFDEDLRTVLRRSGCKNEKIAFIMDESNVLDSGFLERMNTLLANGEVPGLFEGDEYATLMTQCKEGAQKEGLMLDSHEELYKWFTSQVIRNLHVVFTMNPSSEGLKDRAATSPALFNRCVLNWFGDWSTEALYQVGKEFTSKMDLEKPNYIVPDYMPVVYDKLPQPPSHREAIVNSCVFVHQTLHQANARLAKRGGRTMAITPRHYLDFINHYANLFNEKRSELEEQQMHLNVGLRKIKETVDQVEELRRDLRIKSQELEVKNAAANDKLKKMVKDQQEAEKKKVMSQDIQEQLHKQQAVIADKQMSVKEDLDKVEPAVIEAQNAVKSIKKQHLVEVRSMANPPAAVKLALESICLLLGESTTDWKQIRSIIMRENFIPTIVNFSAEEISDSIREKMKKNYMSNPSYNYEIVNRASLACGPMVKWAIAQLNYADMLKRVEPLRNELQKLEDDAKDNQQKANEVEQMIRDLEASIARYKEEYAVLISEAQAIKADLAAVEAKVNRSTALLKSLSAERERWEKTSETFKNQMSTIAGDCLLSGAFIAYAGYFDQQMRQNLFTTWSHHLQQANIQFRTDIARTEYLSNADERLRWQASSLPADDLCTENAIMLKRFNRYPLIIDPSGQATEFIMNEYKDRKITRTSFLDDAFRKNLESALRFGNPLLVQDVESYDPVLNPVLNREVRRTGGRVLITLGDQDIDLSPSFVIFLSTRDPTVEFPPDLCSRVTFVNFTVTRSSLQSQCLNEVLKAERPDVDEKRSDLLKLQGEFQLRLRQLEKSLLQALNEVKGRILDDDTIITTLENLKKEAAEVTRKVEETDIVMQEVETVSQQYLPLSTACSSIYFTMESLKQIHFLYQYSLQFFLDIYHNVLYENPNLKGITDHTQRLSIITKDLFQVAFNRVARGMLHQDHITFAMLLARIKLKGTIGEPTYDAEFQHFLRGKEIVLSTASLPKISGLSTEQIEAMMRLSCLPEFKDLVSKVQSDEQFCIWLDSSSPEQTVPYIWSEEKPATPIGQAIHRLLLIQAFRPDRLLAMAHAFVSANLGESFMSIMEQPLDLTHIVNTEVKPNTPVLMCSVPGYDASGHVEDLAAEQNTQITSIAIGSAEGFNQADKAINTAVKSGRWVMLKNVHLAPGWLMQLEKKLHSLQPHACFRLFLTMEINPKVPVNLLRAGRIFVFEPPPGVKANMLRTFSSIPVSRICKSPNERARLYFLLAWFHAIIQERLRYAPLGWSKKYEFGESDLRSACDTIDTWLDDTAKGRQNISPDKIPWSALKTLMAQSIYGGRIDNEFDQRLLNTFLERLFTTLSFDSEFKLACKVDGHKDIQMPDGIRREEFVQWVELLPDTQTPSWLGLPNNAEKVLLTTQGIDMISKMLKMQMLEDEDDLAYAETEKKARADSTSDGRPSWMRTLHTTASNWFHLIPQNLNHLKRTVENIKDPLFRFFEREVKMGAKLLQDVRQDLADVVQVCEGKKKQTNYLRTLINELVKGILPRSWSHYTVPAGMTVIQWVSDFSERIKQLQNISQAAASGGAKELKNIHVCLGGLFVPEAYITATRQYVAQANSWSLEELCLEVNVTTTQNAVLDACSFGVTGLKLQGATCSNNKLSLSNAISTILPITQLRWIKQTNADKKANVVTLPVYLNFTRADLIFTVDFEIATKEDPRSFYERGVAVLCTE
ncbi:cytoplasmic dynein 1 heavy chain 1 [Chelonoidis abingdonii]|uniref:cytoplasmic dynein 1 heavy chain 1 n=1 Tax=Chelonoidis abingdonii TaxID=106734 RepID=UPI0013F1D7F0|nr:cytoplasmic dynein 1 heavy chain 1 [Chelonoidis abingdonii]